MVPMSVMGKIIDVANNPSLADTVTWFVVEMFSAV
jgi:hypothetical protein